MSRAHLEQQQRTMIALEDLPVDTEPGPTDSERRRLQASLSALEVSGLRGSEWWREVAEDLAALERGR